MKFLSVESRTRLTRGNLRMTMSWQGQNLCNIRYVNIDLFHLLSTLSEDLMFTMRIDCPCLKKRKWNRKEKFKLSLVWLLSCNFRAKILFCFCKNLMRPPVHFIRIYLPKYHSDSGRCRLQILVVNHRFMDPGEWRSCYVLKDYY